MNLAERVVHWAREAKRRRVYTTAIAYVVVTVTVIELSGAIFEALALPDWSSRLVTILLLLGFPVVLVMAWTFDLTREGVTRTAPDPLPDSAATSEPASASRRVTRKGARAIMPLAPGPIAARASIPEPPSEAEAEPPDPARLRRAVIGHVRHELKTPINGILGYSEMLLEDLDDADRDQMAPDLERIREAGRQLLRLIDSILDPEKIDKAGEFELDSYGGTIRADLRNPVNAVIGYAELLIEAAEEDGGDQYVPDLERIRTAGQQLLERSTDIVELATAYDASTGSVAAASTITEKVLARARPTSGPNDHGMGSLLVVDDNPMNRELLSRQLARAGYMVETAADGWNGLERLEQRDFDLVLLDVIMPGIDGLEVLRRIKADERTAQVPVVMLSSLDDVDSAIRCIELGADDFLHKPFHPTLLQARIGASLEIRRMRDRLLQTSARFEGAEDLTLGMLRGSFPDAIAARVRAGEDGILETYGQAAVLWCDVEAMARHRVRDPARVAGRIQALLAALEEVAHRHRIETVAASGTGVMLVAGVPTPDDDDIGAVADTALDLAEALGPDSGLDAPLRAGIDCGEVTAGVFGASRKEYRLWGDPVDLARGLGSGAAGDGIVVSPNAHRLLAEGYAFTSGGVRELPGRGQLKTWMLAGR